MTMKSPTSNGLSTAMDNEANRSPRMFCTASATAIPPTPRLATKAVMFTPRLESIASSTTDHNSTRAPHADSVASALPWFNPSVRCRAK
ncbi:hypothetical protein D3C76_1206640 [compost metagenome]